MSGNIKNRPEKHLAMDIEEKLKEARKKARTRAKKAVGLNIDNKPDIAPVKDHTTALVLSGGAARGAYEMGVWQALRELGTKIDIVCGTSIGAMNSYIVAQDRYDDAVKLWSGLHTEEVFNLEDILENHGVTFTGITEVLRRDFPEENVRKSDMEFGICTVKITEGEKLDLSAVKPLYLWKEDIPEGEMLDYVLASCACYPVVKPYEIDGEKYLDGGYYDYMPIRMALEKGAEKIIVVNLDVFGHMQKEDLEIAGDRMVMIAPSWDLGSTYIFEPGNISRIMRLGYLDAMKAFGVFDGKKYAFVKGSTDNRSIASAERAGQILDLDPGIIYTGESFRKAIAAEIKLRKLPESKSRKNLERELEKLLREGLNWSNIKEAAEETDDHNRERAFLKVCALLTRPDVSDILKAGCRKVLGKDYGAAQWLIKNKLI
ncbi:MAG: patatin-like phospholipase family protein [Clostridia bacterium]|nr:patatin-like phospholipase family protein [Clostridia bacterium]